MFDWIRREWEEWKEFARDEQDSRDVSWLLDEGWERWRENPPLLNGYPIEIKGVGWTHSELITCGDGLRIDVDMDVSLHWRRTGIYREQEEREFAQIVANRLLGKKSQEEMAQIMAAQMIANMNQLTGANPMLSNLLGGKLGSLLGGSSLGDLFGDPYGMG